MKKYIIDRFEGHIAVCEAEDRTMTNIEITKLPEEVQEGSCIIMDERENIFLDEKEVLIRKERIDKRVDELFE